MELEKLWVQIGELESVHRREQQKLAEEERRHAMTKAELASVQKQIEQREADCTKLLAQLEQIDRQKEKSIKKWKQSKKATKCLIEEKEMLDNHFKREIGSMQEQKLFFSKQLEEVRLVLRSHHNLSRIPPEQNPTACSMRNLSHQINEEQDSASTKELRELQKEKSEMEEALKLRLSDLQNLDEHSKNLEVELDELQASVTNLENQINSLQCPQCGMLVEEAEKMNVE
eukprot:TRINITY_DN13076_c0_g1_i1.p1 TRINITY_DN13076_c0_g1~~TRINITY_DN13076_c0_g1_i1.p1  ORF type:complete len:229 (+),score=53.36 TRINITY_DN13076_c0_g1_i1:357-1043(+)